MPGMLPAPAIRVTPEFRAALEAARGDVPFSRWAARILAREIGFDLDMNTARRTSRQSTPGKRR